MTDDSRSPGTRRLPSTTDASREARDARRSPFHDRLAAQGEHRRHVKWHRPCNAAAAHFRQRQVARPAEYMLRAGQCRAATIAQTMQTIFTDTNDR